MVSLDWSIDRTDGVTLVTLRVENRAPDRSRRVRIENRLEGPLWPPRRHGRPAAGWDENGFEGVVDAGGSLALGYATPAGPAEPPVELVTDEPATDEPAGSGTAGGVHTVEETPAGVVRSLGDPIVPREAVPVPDVVGSETGSEPEPGGDDRTDRSRTRPGNGHDGSASGHDERASNRDEGRMDDRDRTLSARLASIERRLSALEAR